MYVPILLLLATAPGDEQPKNTQSTGQSRQDVRRNRTFGVGLAPVTDNPKRGPIHATSMYLKGLEPIRLSAHAPQACMSTNSITGTYGAALSGGIRPRTAAPLA